MNETEDGVYDWMLLNNGKGWESEADVSSQTRSTHDWMTLFFCFCHNHGPLDVDFCGA